MPGYETCTLLRTPPRLSAIHSVSSPPRSWAPPTSIYSEPGPGWPPEAPREWAYAQLLFTPKICSHGGRWVCSCPRGNAGSSRDAQNGGGLQEPGPEHPGSPTLFMQAMGSRSCQSPSLRLLAAPSLPIRCLEMFSPCWRRLGRGRGQELR